MSDKCLDTNEWNIGGVSKNVGKVTLFAEGRYVLGFANINNEPDEQDLKNRGILITAGATVPVGR